MELGEIKELMLINLKKQKQLTFVATSSSYFYFHLFTHLPSGGAQSMGMDFVGFFQDYITGTIEETNLNVRYFQHCLLKSLPHYMVHLVTKLDLYLRNKIVLGEK